MRSTEEKPEISAEALRRKTMEQGLSRDELDPNPIRQF
jgi:hypothetical protein